MRKRLPLWSSPCPITVATFVSFEGLSRSFALSMISPSVFSYRTPLIIHFKLVSVSNGIEPFGKVTSFPT